MNVRVGLEGLVVDVHFPLPAGDDRVGLHSRRRVEGPKQVGILGIGRQVGGAVVEGVVIAVGDFIFGPDADLLLQRVSAPCDQRQIVAFRPVGIDLDLAAGVVVAGDAGGFVFSPCRGAC
jgi:hypothetical protein